MNISFTKYHGTGNDFILYDNRKNDFPLDNHELINKLCHRRFGIGADGLICLQNHSEYDFEMSYFNADGLEGSMCGNGGRCVVQFAKDLGIIQNDNCQFKAVDGVHKAHFEGDQISLAMQSVPLIEEYDSYYFLDTGSPHVVKEVAHLEEINVVEEGQKIRYDEENFPKGTNVNFIEFLDARHIKIRTYERGVEDETWSCGTGAVASAIITSILKPFSDKDYRIHVQANGGDLVVHFAKTKKGFENILLQGPATKVFDGTIAC
jgi:diaminopimelate epimerase